MQTHQDPDFVKIRPISGVSFHALLECEICWQISKCSKSIQLSNKLPWKFPVTLNALYFNMRENELETLNKEILKKISSLPTFYQNIFFQVINDVYKKMFS